MTKPKCIITFCEYKRKVYSKGWAYQVVEKFICTPRKRDWRVEVLTYERPYYSTEFKPISKINSVPDPAFIVMCVQARMAAGMQAHVKFYEGTS